MNTLHLILLFLGLFLVTACVDQWSATGENGARFSEVEPACRAKAYASAVHQLPSPHDRDAGPAAFPPDARQDIENRETALCLQQQGFTLHRSWK